MGRYALKYPKVDPEVMKHEVIPEAANYCARQRADKLWTAKEYRQCLSREIKRLIREKKGL
ncbi:hypothetical protein ES708_33002 [subsurface metagenome]